MAFKNNKGAGAGGTIVLMIFVVLCLVIFSTLSMVSATSDLKMSARNRDAAENYYGADAKAAEKLADIDAVLAQAKKDAESFSTAQMAAALSSQEKEVPQDTNEKYYALLRARLVGIEGITLVSGDGGLVQSFFEIEADSVRKLVVSLRLLPVEQSQRYEILTYQIVNDGEWEPEDGFVIG